MANYSEFHDGALDGLRLDGTRLPVFLQTEWGSHLVAELTGLKAMVADGFRAGNIVFELLVRGTRK